LEASGVVAIALIRFDGQLPDGVEVGLVPALPIACGEDGEVERSFADLASVENQLTKRTVPERSNRLLQCLDILMFSVFANHELTVLFHDYATAVPRDRAKLNSPKVQVEALRPLASRCPCSALANDRQVANVLDAKRAHFDGLHEVLKRI
jgi:hypothetical protein